MPNFALIPNAATVISMLANVVDGYPEGTHKLETTTGGEPLEDGRQVTDHAVARQDRLVLQGWVSDFNGGDRPLAAWSELRRLHKAVTPLSVMTEWGVYPEMLIRRAEAPQTHRGMSFTLELEEVIRVGFVRTEISPERVYHPDLDTLIRQTIRSITGVANDAVTTATSAFATSSSVLSEIPRLPVTADVARVLRSLANSSLIPSNTLLDRASDVLSRVQSLPNTLPGVTRVSNLVNSARNLESSLRSLDGSTRSIPAISRSVTNALALAGRTSSTLASTQSQVLNITRQFASIARTDELNRGRVVLGPLLGLLA